MLRKQTIHIYTHAQAYKHKNIHEPHRSSRKCTVRARGQDGTVICYHMCNRMRAASATAGSALPHTIEAQPVSVQINKHEACGIRARDRGANLVIQLRITAQVKI